jgi:hypothetical protein
MSLDPMISVELDLSNKIEDNIRKCLIKRYIINFVKDVSGNLTHSDRLLLIVLIRYFWKSKI